MLAAVTLMTGRLPRCGEGCVIMNRRLRVVWGPRSLTTVLLSLCSIVAGAACGEPPEDADGVAAFEAPLEVTEVRPDPNTVHIKGVNASGGTGCPQGTVAAIVSADGLSLTLLFDRYVAEMGPQIPLTRSRVQCTVNLGISVPHGHTFTITQIDSRGFVDLPAGVTASQQSSYRMQGLLGDASVRRTELTGPARRTFVASNVFELPTLVFSKCGLETNLNVDTSLLLTGSRTQDSMVALDSLDQSFVQRFHLAWRRCN
jgi:Domain of unknown function (DUF4360)